VNRHDSSGDAFAGLAALAIIAGLIFCLVMTARTAAELVRIYATRTRDPQAAKLLWRALFALLLLWLVAGGLAATNPSLQPLAVYLAAWSFLAYVITVEAIDQRYEREEQALLGDPADLETYLASLEPYKGNGHAPGTLLLDKTPA